MILNKSLNWSQKNWTDSQSHNYCSSLIHCSGVNPFNPELMISAFRRGGFDEMEDVCCWMSLTHVAQNLYTGLHTALLTRDQPGTVIHTEHTLQQLHKHRLPSLKYRQTQTHTIISRGRLTTDPLISPALTNIHSPDSTHKIQISQHCTDCFIPQWCWVLHSD